MGKFCSQCGKPLQEGEVCECQQQNTQNIVQSENVMQSTANIVEQTAGSYENGTNEAFQNPNANMQQDAFQNPNVNMQQNTFQNSNANGQQGPAWNQNVNTQQGTTWTQNENFQKGAEMIKTEGMSVLNRTIRMFKKPIGEIKDMANSDNLMTGLSAVITNMVVILLLSIIAMITVHIKLGEFSSFIKIPYVQIVFMAVVLSAIYDFGLAGSMFLTVKAFFKENTSFAKMLSIVGGKVLLDSVFIAAGCILAILNGSLGLFIIALGMIFSSIVLIIGFYEVSALGSEQKVFAYFIALIIFVIALSIIYYVIAQSAINDLTRALKYLF